MAIEVEQKFRVADLARVEVRAIELGATLVGECQQTDRYYNHPARDFAQTDEALRIRSVSDRNFITYKGPKLDQKTKTRIEHEVPLADGAAAVSIAKSLLSALGFREVAEVKKLRRTLRFLKTTPAIEIALDDVAGVGLFVELEAAVDEGDACAPSVAEANLAVANLAGQLKLTEYERQSYLELLLAEQS